MKQGITILESSSDVFATRWVAGFPYGLKTKEEIVFKTLIEAIEWAKKYQDYPITIKEAP